MKSYISIKFEGSFFFWKSYRDKHDLDLAEESQRRGHLRCLQNWSLIIGKDMRVAQTTWNSILYIFYKKSTRLIGAHMKIMWVLPNVCGLHVDPN